MPSPLAHLAVGYALHRVNRRLQTGNPAPAQPAGLRDRAAGVVVAGATIGLSLLPDLDILAAAVTGDMLRFHNNLSHSFLFALLAACLIGAGIWLFRRRGARRWFALVLVSYSLHIVMDAFTPGRGVLLLWPFTDERFSSTISLFYGLHWSEPLSSPMHLWTVLTELAFAVVVIVLAHVFTGQRAASSPSRRDAPSAGD